MLSLQALDRMVESEQLTVADLLPERANASLTANLGYDSSASVFDTIRVAAQQYRQEAFAIAQGRGAFCRGTDL
jgi:hypothetical protein